MKDWAIYIAAFSGVVVPSIGVAYFIIKSYIAKAKYHITLEAQLEKLNKHDKGSKDIHNIQDDRLKALENKVQKLCDSVDETKGWVRLILKFLKIRFPESKKG